VTEQTIQAMANLMNLLEETGSGLNLVTRSFFILSDINDLTAVYNAYKSFFTTDILPTQTTVIVKAFSNKKAKVEIDLYAFQKATDVVKIEAINSMNVPQTPHPASRGLRVHFSDRHMIFCSGMPGSSSSGEIKDDILEQTKQAMQNLKLLLEENGSSFDHVGRLIVHLSEDSGKTSDVLNYIGKQFNNGYPSITVIFIDMNDLKKKVEIEAIAFSLKDSSESGTQIVEKIQSSNIAKPYYPTSHGTRISLGNTNTIFCTGQVGENIDGVIVSDDPSEQAKQVLKNLKTLLEDNGSSLEYVTRTTMYLTDINDFAAINAVYTTIFTKNLPARETFQVKKLPKEKAKLQIDIVAFSANDNTK